MLSFADILSAAKYHLLQRCVHHPRGLEDVSPRHGKLQKLQSTYGQGHESSQVQSGWSIFLLLACSERSVRAVAGKCRSAPERRLRARGAPGAPCGLDSTLQTRNERGRTTERSPNVVARFSCPNGLYFTTQPSMSSSSSSISPAEPRVAIPRQLERARLHTDPPWSRVEMLEQRDGGRVLRAPCTPQRLRPRAERPKPSPQSTVVGCDDSNDGR